MAHDIDWSTVEFDAKKKPEIDDRPEMIARRHRRFGTTEEDLVKLGWSVTEDGRLTKLQGGKDRVVARAFWDPCPPTNWDGYRILDVRVGGEYGGWGDRTCVPVAYAAERIDSMILTYLEKFQSTWSFDPVK